MNNNRKSVIQDWVQELTFMQQTVLLTAVRGPDGIRKDHVAKKLCRWLRRCILVSAFDGEVLSNPCDQRGGSFTGPSLDEESIGDWPSAMNSVVSDYIVATDELPHHFQMHLKGAAQILGYKHPDPTIRDFWSIFYRRLADDLHMTAETEKQMDIRLGDNELNWLAAGDRSSCGRQEISAT